ncbi:YggT family protein [Hydrogenophaga sp. PAMC20947]|nr:YggT family protein [Hydrogenophaga sp. PAMC20947]
MRVMLFLLDTVFFFLVAAALLRAWMNHLRVHMSAQPGRFAMAVTNWLVQPVRRILPRALTQSRFDWGSFMAAVLLALVYGGLWLVLVTEMTATSASPLAMVAAIATVAGKLLIRVVLQGLMILLLVFAVLSWVQPGAPVMGTLDRLCAPVLAPLRRFIPQIGGVDLSVLVAIILLQIGLIVLGG